MLGQHRRVAAQAARSVKGWKAVAPKLVSERRAVMRRCGPSAFLEPGKLRFPIVSKHGNCAIDCRGLRVAKARAAQYGHRSLVAKADRIAANHACAWEVLPRHR